MTQRERILRMLEEAGPKGVRSDECIKDFMPRAAARVQELKDEGYAISSEREGKYTRWTLTNVGSSTEGRDQPVASTLGVASGVERLDTSPSGGAPPDSLFDLPPAPSAFDPWERDAA